MKRILCFGDSNTWGYNPADGERYPENVRWTGVVQRELGEGYRIIEEGLNARTSGFDDPLNEHLNGRAQLPPLLVSHKPLDLVVLALGTNDLKFVDAWYSAQSAGRLVRMVQCADALLPGKSRIFAQKPKILLISPILIGEGILRRETYSTLKARALESRRFAAEYKAIADAYGVDYLDAAGCAAPSPVDFVHMEPESHQALGRAVAGKLREMLSE